MSEKERNRLIVMQQVEVGSLPLVEAADALGVGYRQARRIWARFERQGASGLLHAGRDRFSNRQFDPALKERVLRLYRGHFGELVQLDGSHHAWFESRGAPSCLMVTVDDATGRTEALLAEGETLAAAFGVLRRRRDARGGLRRARALDRAPRRARGALHRLQEQLSQGHLYDLSRSERRGEAPGHGRADGFRSRLPASGDSSNRRPFGKSSPIRRKPRGAPSARTAFSRTS